MSEAKRQDKACNRHKLPVNGERTSYFFPGRFSFFLNFFLLFARRRRGLIPLPTYGTHSRTQQQATLVTAHTGGQKCGSLTKPPKARPLIFIEARLPGSRSRSFVKNCDYPCFCAVVDHGFWGSWISGQDRGWRRWRVAGPGGAFGPV